MRENRPPGSGRSSARTTNDLEGGFTLVEWVISVVLLAMLAAGGFMLFQLISNTSERAEAQTAMDEYAETIADEIRSIGWDDCHVGIEGSLFRYFTESLNARVTSPVNPVPIPAHTQGDGTSDWQVQTPVIEDVHLGAGLSSSQWDKVPRTAADPPLPVACSNYFVARVTFVVRNYDPTPGAQKPSLPIEIRRQVLVTRS